MQCSKTGLSPLSPLLLSQLSGVLHKALFVNHPCVASISEDADVTKTQLGEALVNQVHGRLDVQSHRGGVNEWSKVRGIRALLIII